MSGAKLEDLLKAAEAINETGGSVTRSILDVSAEEALTFFLKGESYCNFSLPHYYQFDTLLEILSKKIKNKDFNNLCKQVPDLKDDGTPKLNKNKTPKTKCDSPKNHEGVNYSLVGNKDGQYAWRPFQLIHPVIYVYLVHLITDADNWEFLKNRFAEFRNNPKIICSSLPVISNTDESDKAELIKKWWREIELQSIEQALYYNHVIHTDITDCYGAIYTHSISWAIHTKKTAKDKRGPNQLLGNKVDSILSASSHGQTNGIPQGSVLMDFIAEMVLGYADLKLSQKLEHLKDRDYKVIRYRDDYRIFVNDTQLGEEILKNLTEVLMGLGLKLSAQKTFQSNEVVTSSIKAEKLEWLRSNKRDKYLLKHLMLIHDFARRNPNAGSLHKALSDFFKRLKSEKNIEHIPVMIAIITDLAMKNPRTYPECAGVLSKLLDMIQDNAQKEALLRDVLNKFKHIPNTGHLDLWLQRIAFPFVKENLFNEPLCRVLYGERPQIWECSWLKDEFRFIFDLSKIVDEQELSDLKPVVSNEEFDMFIENFWWPSL